MAIIKRETDYALRVLAKLAQEDDCLPVSLLAQEEEVPEEFLRKIMQRLQRAGIVQSRQGPFGGYILARPAQEVTALDVVEAVQGPLVMNECFTEPEICGRVEFCAFRKRLGQLQIRLNALLDEVRLGDVIREVPSEAGATK